MKIIDEPTNGDHTDWTIVVDTKQTYRQHKIPSKVNLSKLLIVVNIK